MLRDDVFVYWRMQTSTPSQQERALAFKALHERPGAFVIPNPWDAGSAKILAHLGFEALATTSGGLAFSLGKTDSENAITFEESMANARNLVEATPLPVSADLENGYGNSPEACAQTILAAAQTGIVGGSIEDATGNHDDPIYNFELSVERVKAAVAAARSLPFHFMLCARAENLLHGRIDLKDTLRRLEAYADAGADVLFAPGLKTREEIEAAVKTVAPRPLNVILGLPNVALTVQDMADLGVKRISLGSSIARAAYDAFYKGAQEILQKGTFNYANGIISYAQINDLMRS